MAIWGVTVTVPQSVTVILCIRIASSTIPSTIWLTSSIPNSYITPSTPSNACANASCLILCIANMQTKGVLLLMEQGKETVVIDELDWTIPAWSRSYLYDLLFLWMRWEPESCLQNIFWRHCLDCIESLACHSLKYIHHLIDYLSNNDSTITIITEFRELHNRSFDKSKAWTTLTCDI